MSTDTTTSGTITLESTTPKALAVPLNDDGSIGTLPEPLQKLIDTRIREATARAKAKADPLDAEQAKAKDAELEALRIEKAEREKRYEDAGKLRDERHQREMAAKDEAIVKRTERLTRAARSDIKAEALRLGAREESLDELADLLGTRISLNEDLDVVVKDAESIAAMVAAYLTAKPHHRKAAAGQSMGLTGAGASGAGVPDDITAIHGRIAKQGRMTGKDIAELAAARAGSRA